MISNNNFIKNIIKQESLLTTENILQSIQVQTIETNDKITTKNNNNNINEINIKYNELKKKINLLWNKLG
jgi:hypothetical protein